ncbi:MAG: DUF6390 family protein [Patescibacteria group bacterium]
MTHPGLKLAARYSFRPFSLGFCGPQENQAKKVVTHYLLGEKNIEGQVRKIFRQFVGAYPYYQLIALKNKIRDPLDKRVVEAYWLGNELLDRVTRKDIGQMILRAFVFTGWMDLARAKRIIENLPAGVSPHHSFHVLFLGSVTDTVAIKGKTIDLCRIACGQVKKASDNRMTVEYKPLAKEPKTRLAGKIKKEIYYEPNFGIKAKIGDWVSFHWNFVCDKLNPKQVKNLEKYTLRNLKQYAQK